MSLQATTHRPRRPLRGAGVLVTRPAGQAEHLCQLITAAGGEPIRFPALEIAAPHDSAVLGQRFDRLAQYDLVVFVSANAVARALPLVEARGGFPGRLTLAAIGGATARALTRGGRRPDVCPSAGYNSEALLAEPRLQRLDGARVLIVRGEGGRELLADTLHARGAQVDYAEVYRRVQPAADAGAIVRRWQQGEIDFVVVTSNQALANLNQMVGEEGREWLHNTPLVVISDRMLQLAHELGFSADILVADQPTDESIVAAMVQ